MVKRRVRKRKPLTTEAKEKHSSKMKQWRIANPIKALIVGARSRSRQRGELCNITLEDLEPVPTHCPYLAIPLRKTGRRTDNSYSIDRRDPECGYMKGNVLICSWKANRIKGQHSITDLLKLGLAAATGESGVTTEEVVQAAVQFAAKRKGEPYPLPRV